MPSSCRDHCYSHIECRYECTVCKQKFVFKSSIQLHRRVHLKQKLFKCFAGNCKHSYKWRQDLHHHIQRHIQTVHRCDKCENSSPEDHMVRRHQVVHCNVYKYFCPRYLACPFKSKYYTSNQRHLVRCKLLNH